MTSPLQGMTIEAPAKINFTLEVYGRRPDGYHDLRSLVVPVSLADTLDVELTNDGVFASDTGYPDDLCLKASKRLLDRLDCPLAQLSGGRRLGVRIRVTKRIPVGGGLGGGSADAAATLRALNELCRLGKTPEALAEIGADVGSDVPALVLAQHYRRSVLMEGRGEKVSLSIPPVPRILNQTIRQSDDPAIHLVLANPGIAVSTAEAYRLCVPRTEPATEPVNDLQAPVARRHPEIARTLDALIAAGATDVRMTGSGATCFGFVSDAEGASQMADRLNGCGLHAFAVRAL